MNKLILIAFLLAFVTISCKKPDDGTPEIVPTNLTITANVSTDNSGLVKFVATASNAVLYTFNFGNSITAISATGTLDYHYTTSGLYTVTVVAKSSSGKTASATTMVTVVVQQGLVWADNFDSDGSPNSSNWGYDLGAGGWGNNELQYYTSRTENVSVSGGTLKINLRKESWEGSSYTSARLLSKGKFSFKYGKIEIRAKIPSGGGTWPAIWMLGDNISTAGWPGCGEVDIMEHVGNQLNRIFSTLHHPGHSGGNGDGGSLMLENATTDFHIYALEWSPTLMKFTVDNSVIYTFANRADLPFNQNFFIILNVAMGGNFGGAVDAAVTNATMEVDYVRVYQ